jgi:hypothetical protein
MTFGNLSLVAQQAESKGVFVKSQTVWPSGKNLTMTLEQDVCTLSTKYWPNIIQDPFVH